MVKDTEKAAEVASETLRTWKAYREYAWGHDVLKPLSKSFYDWYEHPLMISPVDAYSTLYLMGFTDETVLIEQYVIDSLDFDLDVDVKLFEVNIRILGGLLSMYDLSGNQAILAKAEDFGRRILPAFDTPTGIPRYWVNLKNGTSHGDTVNVAEAGTYTLEMGVLSYYTGNPVYYQAARKATLALFNRRDPGTGLIGDIIDVNTGEWVSGSSHICAGADSYYEYLCKSYLLFRDSTMGAVWDYSVKRINQYMAEEYNGDLWYGRADMKTGILNSSVITLYDAFFPAVLALTGDLSHASRLQQSWFRLWNKYGLEPMVYDYKKEQPSFPRYDLNPEIIESAFYLYKITGDTAWLNMNIKFWNDLKKYCRTDVAFTSVDDVTTMKQRDYMPTFFLAETLKYFWLTFSNREDYLPEDIVFNTEAHPFRKSHFDPEKVRERLGL
ncbi:MAG: hypothetical protein Kow00127_07660 [Bacteroidales bacterium]